MERKVEIKKGKVIKKINENLLSEYLHLGWKIVEVKHTVQTNNKVYKKSIVVDEEED